MKILVHGLSSGIGGVETFLLNYCPSISRIYPEIDFEYVFYDSIPDYAAERGIPIEAMHVVPSRESSLVGFRKALSSLLKGGGFDCVWGNYCSLSDVGVLQAAEGSVPIRIAHAHSSQNMGTAITAFLHNVHKAQIGRLATDLFSCSNGASEFMFPEDAVRKLGLMTVANGIDVERFAFDETARKELRNAISAGDNLMLAYVGRMSPEKNPLFAIDVARTLKEASIEFDLVMLGDGPLMDEVKGKVEELDLADEIHLLGSVPHVEGWLSAADVLIMPSEFEGLPLTLVEAQASGLSCVVSTGVSEQAVITNQVDRISLSDPVESWVEAVVRGGDASRARERKACSRCVADAGFDISRNAQDLGAWFLRRFDEVQSEADKG